MLNPNRLYAALDSADEVRLYRVVDGELALVNRLYWERIVGAWDAVPGQLFAVSFTPVGESPDD